jgi:hypothetical protein
VSAAVDCNLLNRDCRAYGDGYLGMHLQDVERVAIKAMKLKVSGPLAQEPPRPTCPYPFARHSFEPMHLFTW